HFTEVKLFECPAWPSRIHVFLSVDSSWRHWPKLLRTSWILLAVRPSASCWHPAVIIQWCAYNSRLSRCSSFFASLLERATTNTVLSPAMLPTHSGQPASSSA